MSVLTFEQSMLILVRKYLWEYVHFNTFVS